MAVSGKDIINSLPLFIANLKISSMTHETEMEMRRSSVEADSVRDCSRLPRRRVDQND